MCMGPEIAVPLLMSAAGTGANMLAQSKVRDRQDDIARYYQQQARSRQDEALAAAAQGLGSYENPAERQAALTAENLQIAPTQQAPGMEVDYAGSAPDALKKDIQRRIVDTVREGKERSKELAELSSYGQLFNRAGLENQDIADQIGTLSNFTRGEGDTMRFEMGESHKAGQGMNTISDLFKAGAMGSNLYYATQLPGQQPWTFDQRHANLQSNPMTASSWKPIGY